MKKCLAAVLALGLLLLSACAILSGENSEPPEGAYALYFPLADLRTGDAAVDFEYRVMPEGQEPVNALVEALLSGPEDEDLTTPFPGGVRLRSWSLEEGRLWLDMSERYSGLSGIDLTIANYCLTLTLGQLEGVEELRITVMGEELPFWHSDGLRPEDALLSGDEELPLSVDLVLYYPRVDGAGLGVEYRTVLLTEETVLAQAVMEAYVLGPSYESLRLTLPEGTELLGAAVTDGVCYVNFTQPFLDAAPQDAEEAQLLVYSIVNTVGSLERVQSVQLQVEGENLTEYGGMWVSALAPDFAVGSGVTAE